MNANVKICGIQTLADADIAIQYGADFIGLNFVPTSKRLILIESAKKIIKRLKGSVKIVGIFQNQSIAEVNTISNNLALDYVQLHGVETPHYCAQISAKIIKAFSLGQNFDEQKVLTSMKKYQVSYFLLDRKTQGNGPMLLLHQLKNISRKYQIFVAGGLNTENIANTIQIVKPFAVDVAGGVATNGKIDTNKVKTFIQQAKSINY